MKKIVKNIVMSSLILLIGMSHIDAFAQVETVFEETEGKDVYRNEYHYVYGMDPQTFDYLYTFKYVDTLHLANFVDGLLEHDEYGQLIGALATDYESNEDATVWTFHLRKDAKWYTDEGVEYASVTADDFVAGLQHAADFQSQTLYLVQFLIAGLDDYVNGKIGFDDVGIKAIDDYTLEYTLNSSTPYFHTMTTYSILLPVNREFLQSRGRGCKLGSPDFSTCSFGALKSDAILYNGAYLLTNFTPKSVIEYEKNKKYYDASHVYIPKVRLLYYNEGDPSNIFNMFDKGELSSAPVYSTNPGMYKLARKKYGDSIFVTDSGSSSYFGAFVFDRNAYASTLHPDQDVSPKTQKQKEDTKKAILNQKFRQSIIFALDTATVNAQEVGEGLKYTSLRNTLTQPDFVYSSDGKPYAELLAEQLIKRNPSLYSPDISLKDGQMAYYQVNTARSLMGDAKKELKAKGVSFPIYLDLQVNGEVDMAFRTAQAFKSIIEKNLNGDVKINLIISNTENLVAVKRGDQVNSDIIFATAWSPDYGDPKTYLDILDPDTGDMLKIFGLNYTGSEVGDDAKIKEEMGLYQFKELKQIANEEVNNLDKRYELYAKAEAYVIDQGYIIPYGTSGGSYAVTRIVPYTKSYAPYGLSSAKYKRMQVCDEVISVKEREELKAQWEEKVRLLNSQND